MTSLQLSLQLLLPCTCLKCTTSLTDPTLTTIFALFSNTTLHSNNPHHSFATILSILDGKIELSNIEQFKNQIPSNHPGYSTMIQRYLTAAKNDLEKATHLLTQTLIWRYIHNQEMGNVQLRTQRLQVVDQYYTLGLLNHGQTTDKEGRTIWIERVGLSDCNVVTQDGTVYNNETLEETFIRAHVTKYYQALSLHSERILIMDMEELTASHVSSTVALGLIQSMAHCDQRHFPGTLHKLTVINAPFLFIQVFGLVSSWLAPETAAVFKVLGDPLLDEDVRQELLQDINETDLPKRYGGTSNIGLPRLHWCLRRGENPLDTETKLTIESGEIVKVALPLSKWKEKLNGNAGGNGGNGALPALVIRSLRFNVQIEVCVIRILDNVEVVVPLIKTETLECQGKVIRRELILESNDIDMNSCVAIVVTFDHSAHWRQRTIFVELEGVQFPGVE